MYINGMKKPNNSIIRKKPSFIMVAISCPMLNFNLKNMKTLSLQGMKTY